MARLLNPPSIYQPASAYSHGFFVPAGHDIVVTSGTVGVRPDGMVPDDFAAQCRLVFRNIQAILADAGLDLHDVVRLNGFLVRREDTAAFRAIRDEFLGHRPASTVVIADLLDPTWLIELEVVAARKARGGA